MKRRKGMWICEHMHEAKRVTIVCEDCNVGPCHCPRSTGFDVINPSIPLCISSFLPFSFVGCYPNQSNKLNNVQVQWQALRRFGVGIAEIWDIDSDRDFFDLLAAADRSNFRDGGFRIQPGMRIELLNSSKNF